MKSIVEQVVEATEAVLERMGYHIPDNGILRRLEKNGAMVDYDTQVVRFPRPLLREALREMPSDVRLCDRNLDPVSNEGTKFLPSGTGTQVIDAVTGRRRPSCREDVRDFAILQSHLKNIDCSKPVVTAADFGERSDLLEFYEIFSSSPKHVFHHVRKQEHAEIVMEMASEVVGGFERLKSHPVFTMAFCPKSPLAFTKDHIQSILYFAKHSLPVMILGMSMGGATSPATLAGQLVMANSEVIGGAAIIQLLHPGAPVMYGSVSSVLDMKTSILALGAPERAVLHRGVAMMARHYGMKVLVGGFSTDAKEIDVQSGFEKAITALPLVGEVDFLWGMGVMDSAGTYSVEQLVLDDEFAQSIRVAAKNPVDLELKDEVDVIVRLGFHGDYLGDIHTFQNFQGYLNPRLLIRDNYVAWERKGQRVVDRVQHVALDILAKGSAAPLGQDRKERMAAVLGRVIPGFDG